MCDINALFKTNSWEKAGAKKENKDSTTSGKNPSSHPEEFSSQIFGKLPGKCLWHSYQ